MGDVGFAHQLAELEQASRLRSMQNSGGSNSRSQAAPSATAKYTNYNTIYRANSNGQGKATGGSSGETYASVSGGRRQRNQSQVSNQGVVQGQNQFYRSYDSPSFQYQGSYQTFEPIPRPASASANVPGSSSSSSQFLESLLVQQMHRSQTATPVAGVQAGPAPLNTNFGFLESTTSSSTPTTATSTLLTSQSAFGGAFDSFPSLQSQLSLYPGNGSTASPTQSQFQPHQLMDFIFGENGTSTPGTITRPDSVLRSASENSSSASASGTAGATSGPSMTSTAPPSAGLVDPLESIWKRDTNPIQSFGGSIGEGYF